MELGKYKNKNNIKMSGISIPEVKEFIYLGLPIGDKITKNEFVENKMSKVERAFYSLYGIGCKPHALSHKTIAFLYKQFCQSILRYGLDNIFLNNNQISNLDIRQNILIKRALGLSKYCKTTPLLQVLKVESVRQLYNKHKIFMYKQAMNNSVTSEILEFLYEHYTYNKPPASSIIAQLREVETLIKIENCTLDLKTTIQKIENMNKCQNIGLLDSIEFINKNITCYVQKKKLLEMLLNYENFTHKQEYLMLTWLPEKDPENLTLGVGEELWWSLDPGGSFCESACPDVDIVVELNG